MLDFAVGRRFLAASHGVWFGFNGLEMVSAVQETYNSRLCGFVYVLVEVYMFSSHKVEASGMC